MNGKTNKTQMKMKQTNKQKIQIKLSKRLYLNTFELQQTEIKSGEEWEMRHRTRFYHQFH